MRTSTGRRVGVCRGVVRKPLGSAMCGRHDRLVHVEPVPLGSLRRRQHPLVVPRHHLGEPPDYLVPLGEQVGRHCRSGLGRVLGDDFAKKHPVVVVERIEIDHLGVEPLLREVKQVSTPPDMPAAMLRPVGPRMTTRPPVMYSHAWSPTPSTTATAPELRTANRSPTTPRMNTSPLVAP